MKKNWIIILIIAIIIIGIMMGVFIYNKNRKESTQENVIENKINEISEKVTDECTEELEELNKQAKLEKETNSSEEKISPNCRVTLKRYYNQCRHIINEYVDILPELVNQTKEQLQKEYINWEIKKYSSTEIVLYKEFDSECGQHFVLRNNDGKIAIYIKNANNQEELYEKTEISVDYLTETDKVKIQNGIEVYGKESLNQLIEDFE